VWGSRRALYDVGRLRVAGRARAPARRTAQCAAPCALNRTGNRRSQLREDAGYGQDYGTALRGQVRVLADSLGSRFIVHSRIFWIVSRVRRPCRCRVACRYLFRSCCVFDGLLLFLGCRICGFGAKVAAGSVNGGVSSGNRNRNSVPEFGFGSNRYGGYLYLSSRRS
jgi:hypothetical protein